MGGSRARFRRVNSARAGKVNRQVVRRANRGRGVEGKGCKAVGEGLRGGREA